MPIQTPRYLVLTALVLAAVAPCAPASTLSFIGNLRTDATVTSCGAGCTLGPTDADATYAQFAAAVYTFNVATTSTVEAVSFSYGGGTNGNGTVIPAGGLEPYLSLFNANGDFLASTYAGICPPGANTVGGNCFDVLLDAGTLTAGTYQIALTAYDNLSLAENYGSGNLADGFTGLGNLATGENLNYAFDVDLTPTTPPPPPTSPVPEPATLSLVGPALLGLRLICRRLR